MKKNDIPAKWQWFNDARYGMFIHWGPYAVLGDGEQVLYHQCRDQKEYSDAACKWNPRHYDPKVWAKVARQAGMKYAVLTTRHHDGYCLWETRTTDYSSAAQAPRRDFVREYVAACRAEGIRIGLYYSLLDWRIPAWYDGPERDPRGWAVMKKYVYDQVRELMTDYGRIDILWFDGMWPRTSKDLQSRELIAQIRSLQPDILINDRLENPQHSYYWRLYGHPGVPKEDEIGDYGTPEMGIHSSSLHLWEACFTSTTHLWGYAEGWRYRSTESMLELLVECARREGNLIMNVGPDADGLLPPEFVERVTAIGKWLEYHGEAIYASESSNAILFSTWGWETANGNNLYLIMGSYSGRPSLRMHDLATPIKRVSFLATGQDLKFTQTGDALIIEGLPPFPPTRLFPVIKVECAGRPEGGKWSKIPLWGGELDGFRRWAEKRGTSVWTDGKPR